METAPQFVSDLHSVGIMAASRSFTGATGEGKPGRDGR